MQNTTIDWAKLTKQLRNSLGLKQSAFAEFIGTTQATISRWELGSQIPEERFRRRIRDELARRDLVGDETLILSMIKYSACMMSLVDRDLRFVTYSNGLRYHAGEKIARIQGRRWTEVMTPIISGIYVNYLRRMFERNSEIVSVSVNDRSALVTGLYTRRSWSAIRLSGERFLVCQDQIIPTNKARFLDLEVITLDGANLFS